MNQKGWICCFYPFKTKATWIWLSCAPKKKESRLRMHINKVPYDVQHERCWNCMHCHRHRQGKTSGLIISCPLATKWAWRRVQCAWIKKLLRLVMQWDKLLSWRTAWKDVEIGRTVTVTDKEKHRVWSFLVHWQPIKYGDGSIVHG